MASNDRKVLVYIQNVCAGSIAETDEGYVFIYHRDYLQSEKALAVSLTLPLRDSEYHSTILFPFF